MNTLLITVDALRADHLSHYGYERDTMPVLDRLERDGVRFENAFANGPYTRISVPALHTGQYLGYETIQESPTIASVLGDAGMTTAGFGTSAGLNKVDVEGDLIFDTYVDFGIDERSKDLDEARPLRDRVAASIAQHRFMEIEPLYKVAKSVYDRLPLAVGNPVPTGGYTSAEDVTDGALDWIRSHREEEFFVWIHYMEAHRPHGIHDDRHEFVDGPVDPDRAREIARKADVRPEAVTESERQLLVDLYDSDVRYCSRHLDRLFDELEREGLWDETNVLFSSDHGEGFGAHGHYFHGHQPYDELIHVPLIARGPAVPSGDAITDQRELVDLAPTISEWHGVDASGYPFDGEHLFEGDGRQVMAVGSQLNSGPVVAGRWDGWKYMSVEGDERLYDLSTDPGELTSVADERPDVVTEFRERIPDALFEQEPEELDVPDNQARREQLAALGYLDEGDE